MSIRRCDVNDRISGFPFEPFDRNTDIYPHYVTFMKDGIKVILHSTSHIVVLGPRSNRNRLCFLQQGQTKFRIVFKIPNRTT